MRDYLEDGHDLNQETTYELNAIVLHHGTHLNFGHYTGIKKFLSYYWTFIKTFYSLSTNKEYFRPAMATL